MSIQIKHPAIRYHGGKFRLAPWIIEQIAPQADGTCQVTTRQYSDIFYQYDDAPYPGSVS